MIKTTRLEYFESGQAQIGMDLGIVSEGKFAMFVRYKAYEQLRLNGVPSTQAMEEAAEIVGCSASRMYLAVKFFIPLRPWERKDKSCVKSKQKAIA